MVLRLCLLAAAAGTGIIVGCVSAVLLTMSFWKRSRRLLKWGALSGLLALTLIAGSASYAVAKTYKRMSVITWAGMVDTVREADTTVKPLTCEEWLAALYAKPIQPSAGITDFQGAYVDYFILSSHFVRYRASKTAILDTVSSTPAETCSISSDVTCRPISREVAILRFPSDPTVLKGLVPWWRPEEVKDAECYECLRFPWQHTIMFDRSSDLVYHVVHEIRE